MLLPVVLTLAFQASATMDRWLRVYRDAEETDYIDMLSIRIEGQRRWVWNRVDYDPPRRNETWSTSYYTEFDCSRRIAIVHSATDRNRAGDLIASDTFDPPQPRQVLPGRIGEKAYLVACALDR